MTAEERKAFVRRQIDELWNNGNLDSAEECFTQDFVSHDPSSPEEVRGPEGFEQNVAEVRAAFPDFRMRIVDQVAEAKKVVTRYVTTCTH
jgi:predicted ester cyclase